MISVRIPEVESENLFFKTPPRRRLSIWGAAVLAAVAGRTAVERRPYRMGSRHLGGDYRTMMFSPLGTNSS